AALSHCAETIRTGQEADCRSRLWPNGIVHLRTPTEGNSQWSCRLVAYNQCTKARPAVWGEGELVESRLGHLRRANPNKSGGVYPEGMRVLEAHRPVAPPSVGEVP